MQQVFANILCTAREPRIAAGARLCREMFPTYFHSREEEQDVPIEEPPRGTRGRSERVTGSYALGVEMIELVFAVCMVDQPSRCKDVKLNFEGDSISAGQCMMNGQIEMAKWIGEHPNWVIRKWRCGIAGQFADL